MVAPIRKQSNCAAWVKQNVVHATAKTATNSVPFSNTTSTLTDTESNRLPPHLTGPKLNYAELAKYMSGCQYDTSGVSPSVLIARGKAIQYEDA